MPSKNHSSGTRKRTSRASLRRSGENSHRARTKRILVVDDHGFFASGLASLINNEDDIEVCGTCARLGSVAASVKDTKPDLVILDVSVAGENGVEVANALQAGRPGLKFMFLSSFPGGVVHRHAKDLKPGAVVEKTQDPVSILRAIRRALRK